MNKTLTVRDAQCFIESNHCRGRNGKDEVLKVLARYAEQYGEDTILLGLGEG